MGSLARSPAAPDEQAPLLLLARRGEQGSRSTGRSAVLGTAAWSSAAWSSPQITFDDVLSKFGSHIYGEGEESGEMGSIVEEGPSLLQDTQQFFTPQGKGEESRGGAEVPPGETIAETAHCKQMQAQQRVV